VLYYGGEGDCLGEEGKEYSCGTSTEGIEKGGLTATNLKLNPCLSKTLPPGEAYKKGEGGKERELQRTKAEEGGSRGT